MKNNKDAKIAVIIPCYKVVDHIKEVINGIGSEVSWIVCVDDACPDNSGQYIQSNLFNDKVVVLFHENNQGVGGATLTGFEYAVNIGAEIMVKVDGDGQMDTSLISAIVDPIIKHRADYVKGNRFYYVENILNMPYIRIFGNLILSFMTKVSTGYWSLFDPTNGFLAIHSKVFLNLPVNKISKDYFFESDILFQLNVLRAVVVDIPMSPLYKDEKSNLNIMKNIPIFFYKHVRNTVKRIFYNYYLRDFSVGSIALPLSLLLAIFGTIFGVSNWIYSLETDTFASAGTVILPALSIIISVQLFVLFLVEDIKNIPEYPIHTRIK